MKKLKTFECRINNVFRDGSGIVSNHVGLTPAKARYKFWQKHQDCLAEYSHCFPHIKSRCLGTVEPHHFYSTYEHWEYNFDRMKEHRNIPFAKRGMIVEVDGEKGWITGSNNGMNLDVLFEGNEYTTNCHPHWEIIYYDEDGNMIKNYKQELVLK